MGYKGVSFAIVARRLFVGGKSEWNGNGKLSDQC